MIKFDEIRLMKFFIELISLLHVYFIYEDYFIIKKFLSLMMIRTFIKIILNIYDVHLKIIWINLCN